MTYDKLVRTLTPKVVRWEHASFALLVVGLVKDRDARVARGDAYGLDEVWRPDSMPGFDDPRVELDDPGLLALCERANVARADDRPVLRMLRDVAAALARRGVADVLRCERDFVVFAVDFGGESGQHAARRAAPKDVAGRLRAAKLL